MKSENYKVKSNIEETLELLEMLNIDIKEWLKDDSKF